MPLRGGETNRVVVVAEDALGNNASIGYDIAYEPGAAGSGGLDTGSLLLPLLNVVLVVCILAVVLRYRSMVRRTARRGNGGNGRNGHRNGRAPQNGGGGA